MKTVTAKKKEIAKQVFKTPDFLRVSKFGQKGVRAVPKFNLAKFHTQHKGGS